MKRICHIALILFGFFMIATTVFGWSHRIRLLDRNNDFCPSEMNDTKDLLVRYQRKFWAFPLFASWDYTADPVYEFYNSTFPNGRRRDCPFYRPDLGYRSGEGKCENCYRIKPFSKRRTEADSFQTHWGLDVHAPEGTPLIAAANGIVKYTGPWSQYYFMYDPTITDTTYEFQYYEEIDSEIVLVTDEISYYVAADNQSGGHKYGNVVLIYYPCWGITVMYSHLQDIMPYHPYWQDIERAADYEEMDINSGDYFGNVGHSGNASSDTAKMHVDIMVFTGEISLDSTTNKDTSHLQDPHDWMYEKSVKTEVTHYRRRQKRYCTGSGGTALDTTIQDTVAIWNIADDFSFGELAEGDTFNHLVIPEGESGRDGGWHYFFKTIHYEFDQGGAHYPYVYIFSGPYGVDNQYCHIRPYCPNSKIGYVLNNLEEKGILSISPNPFNSICRITGSADLLDPNRKDSYSIAPTAVVYDIKGQKVSQIEIENTGASYKIDWDGTDQSGQQLPSGAYFIRFIVNDKPQTAKVTLLR